MGDREISIYLFWPRFLFPNFDIGDPRVWIIREYSDQFGPVQNIPDYGPRGTRLRTTKMTEKIV